MIRKINKLSGYRVFRNFTWNKELPDFQKYNLLYGWNGTGKSTISNLFRVIERKSQEIEGEFEIETSTCRINNRTDFNKQLAPNIRVFNEDFVEDHVFTSTNEITPIFFEKEEDRANSKEIQELESTIPDLQQNLAMLKNKLESRQKLLDQRKTFIANKVIKVNLGSTGNGLSIYRNYDKSNLERKCKSVFSLNDHDYQFYTSTNLNLDTKVLESRKSATTKERINMISIPTINVQELTNRSESLLSKSLTHSFIEVLQSDTSLSSWIESGLKLHKQREKSYCMFCNNKIDSKTINEYEDHFNNEYEIYKRELNSETGRIENLIDMIKKSSNSIPEPLRLHNELQNIAKHNRESAETAKNELINSLKDLLSIVGIKIANPFSVTPPTPVISQNLFEILNDANSIIQRHNAYNDEIETLRSNAIEKLEDYYFAQYADELKTSQQEIDLLTEIIKGKQDHVKTQLSRLDTINNIASNHVDAADELNIELSRFLGRDELSFEVHGLGYRLIRDGLIATHISEGERKAISFLYFLKSLSSMGFDLTKSVVVIDDPISSLDSNFRYNAFSYMIERVKDAEQVIILTHNIQFFHLVYDWISQYKKEHQVYMIQSIKDNLHGRKSVITKPDKFLTKYQGEYQLLFHQVFNIVHNGLDELIYDTYHSPNIARKLLESFLSFKCPNNNGKLRQQLSEFDFIAISTRLRILKYVHNNSHKQYFDETEREMLNPIETKSIFQDILAIIEEADKWHYDQMVKLITENRI